MGVLREASRDTLAVGGIGSLEVRPGERSGGGEIASEDTPSLRRLRWRSCSVTGTNI